MSSARPYVIVDAAQRSPEWFAARLGKVTGTCARPMLSAGQGNKEAAGRRDLRVRLVIERVTGVPQEEDGWQSADMKRGIELESEARAAYEAAASQFVTTAGFLQHLALPIGHSPDGLLDDGDGLLELKVPKSATHLNYWRGGAVPAEYLPQITHGLLVTGASFCDFASYDPRFPDGLQLFLVRVKREDVDLKAYETALLAFLAEVDRECQEVLALQAKRRSAA